MEMMRMKHPFKLLKILLLEKKNRKKKKVNTLKPPLP
jgi:hypothetical protein